MGFRFLKSASDGIADGDTLVTGLVFPNTGLHILDTDASHDLIIKPGSNLTADRTLTVTTGDADRTLTISASATVSQDYSTTGNPQFATIELGAASDTTLSRSSAGNIAIEGNVVYRASGTDVALADGGTGASLADPNADRIMFWDDSDGAVAWLEAGTGLSISGTTIAATGREKLSAARTYYVRTDGSDSNTGLVDSAGGAFLTIQKAVDVASALDNGGYDITIDVGNGTYTGAVSFAAFAGAGKIIIVGDETTPSNVIISTTSNSCFTHGLTAGTTGTWAVRGLRVQTTTSGSGFRLLNDAIVEIQNVDFGACADNHIQANKHTKFTVTGNYSISGGAIRHVNAGLGAFVSYVNALTLTISASCGFTTFVLCTSGSNVDFRGITITLGGGVAVTGTRYSATLNGVIQSNGGGATYFPGDVAGSTATGGQYA